MSQPAERPTPKMVVCQSCDIFIKPEADGTCRWCGEPARRREERQERTQIRKLSADESATEYEYRKMGR